jgi:adenosylhomocysteine nucleosidase
MAKIVVQGAMPNEIDLLVGAHPGGTWATRAGYAFYEAGGLVVARTGVGIMNAAISTMEAIRAYAPACVVNQGAAGGATRETRVCDLVIGLDSAYINDLRMPPKGAGMGSDALAWRAGGQYTFRPRADERLVALAREIPYAEGRVFLGTLGAGDVFSREIDRIDQLHSWHDHLCEDMESAAVYRACEACGVPVIGIRAISNNELTGQTDDEALYRAAQVAMQRFMARYVERLREEYA